MSPEKRQYRVVGLCACLERGRLADKYPWFIYHIQLMLFSQRLVLFLTGRSVSVPSQYRLPVGTVKCEFFVRTGLSACVLRTTPGVFVRTGLSAYLVPTGGVFVRTGLSAYLLSTDWWCYCQDWSVSVPS